MHAPPPLAHDLVFYDGTCGLCHGLVKFLIARDRDGSKFAYAPLQGETFSRRIPAGERAAFPDSVAVLTADGDVLVKSRAVRRMLRQIGGGWALLAAVAGIVPRPLLDWGYDAIARVRKKGFKTPEGACPIVPGDLRKRFLP
jgi:predicted DCC family thiol-disulfide oxidoreductase YuxK